MIIGSDGKTTYTDAASLSNDLGDRVRRGDKDALKELKTFAATLDPEQPHSQARALYELSEVFFNGLCGVKKSPEEAMKFLIQAADLNDELALIQLGRFYSDGKYGLKQDVPKALELFSKAADKGNQDALMIMAGIYRDGKGTVEADGYKVIEIYERLDALDYNQALLNLAQVYEEGCGQLKPDGYKALEIYDEIIRHGRYWAEVRDKFGISSMREMIYNLALGKAIQIYREGKAGVTPDQEKANKLSEELAW